MTPATARSVLIAAVAFACIGAGFWLHSLWPGFRQAPVAQSPVGTADALQAAFVMVAQRVRPAVVHVGTIQVARPRRGPTIPGPMQDDPFFKDFFDQFFGRRAPGAQEEFRQSGLGSGVIIDKKGLVL